MNSRSFNRGDFTERREGQTWSQKVQKLTDSSWSLQRLASKFIEIEGKSRILWRFCVIEQTEKLIMIRLRCGDFRDC